ncbi:MAG: glycine/sarcosine/betaine reductase component B subunit, partial [Candidatus Entotheonellia bacterium]
EYHAAIRLAGLKAAVYLAQARCQEPPDTVEVYDLPPVSRIPPACQDLPRVAYVFQIHSHQRPTGLEEGILYGDNVRRLIPTVLHPNEVLDGAVLRGFMGRNATTYAIQNHPVIQDLYRRHGQDIWFAGVVVTAAQATEPERVRSALITAELVTHILGADGAIFTKIGGGAPHVDMAQAAEHCERLGVKTVLLVEEMSTDGSSEGALLFNFQHMDALVSLGNSQVTVSLPAMARVLGIPWDIGACQRAAGVIEGRLGMICGAVEQVGASHLTATVL